MVPTGHRGREEEEKEERKGKVVEVVKEREGGFSLQFQRVEPDI